MNGVRAAAGLAWQETAHFGNQMNHRPDKSLDRARHLLGQQPPSAENAECELLSCVMQNAGLLHVAQDIITTPEVFARPGHAAIWEAVCRVGASGSSVSLSAVEAVLSGRNLLTLRPAHPLPAAFTPLLKGARYEKSSGCDRRKLGRMPLC